MFPEIYLERQIPECLLYVIKMIYFGARGRIGSSELLMCATRLMCARLLSANLLVEMCTQIKEQSRDKKNFQPASAAWSLKQAN